MPDAKSLCLIVIASLAANLQAATLQIDKAPTPAFVLEARSAKTFRIVVHEPFGEAPAWKLPFADTIRALLKSTNLLEVNDDADITIVVKAVGRALGAQYNMEFCYTGAELSGSLRLTARSGLYCDASFNKRLNPPHIFTTWSTRSVSSPSSAPFNDTFDAFATKLCGIALDLFGVYPLLSALKDKNENLRIGVITTLRSISDPTLLDALVAALGDQSDGVRNVAAETLSNMPDTRVSDTLVRSLKSSSIDVRSRAAQILSKRKDCCPVAPLLEAFDDRRGTDKYLIEVFRSRVALALGATKEPLALQRLVLAARSKSEGLRVHTAIAEALGNFQDPTAAETLIGIVEDALQHESTRSTAVRALGLTRDPRAVPLLIRIVEDARQGESTRSTAVRALGLTRDPRAVPLLIRTLRDPSRSVRQDTAFSLRFFRETRVVEALIGTGLPQDGYMLPEAAESLKKLTGQTLYGAVQWQKWWADDKHTFEQQPKQ